ncbi:hypothetical protein BDA96_08G112100 [Sorghum bicolor]|uniref:Uncharacterized protein n=2 Tax=Sorghum bicolor TaxID=4558 RepID=A0A921QG19_SORBI|nr:hypothetical protein BDA96_08G112100 [Sorghum bicolor]KXG23479.1 hypothetical protein SORBI_3008G100900 [Sorghum bicolor]
MRGLTHASSSLIWTGVNLAGNIHSADHQLGRGAFHRWSHVRKQNLSVQQYRFVVCRHSQENSSRTRLSCKASFWLGKTEYQTKPL